MNGEREEKKKKSSMCPPRVVTARRLRWAGQVILEFTFCMVVVLLMIYGVIKVFFWTSRDLVERRKAHDDKLFNAALSPLDQVNPDFYTSKNSMNAIWGE